MTPKNLVISPVNVEERKNLDIRAGDAVKVWQKIKEKDKYRLQVFEGLVLSVKHGKESGGTFTVRRISGGIGIERIFPIYSPMIEKVEVIKRSKVRRAKLYHIREKAAKEIKRQMRNVKNLPDIKEETQQSVSSAEEFETSDRQQEEQNIEPEAKEKNSEKTK